MNNGSQIFTNGSSPIHSILNLAQRCLHFRHCGRNEKPETENPGSGLMVHILVPRTFLLFWSRGRQRHLRRVALGMRMACVQA